MSEPSPFLSPEACKALFTRVTAMGSGGGSTHLSLISRWTGTVRWNGNRVAVASDARTIDLTITRDIRGAAGVVTTTRIDDDGLRQALRLAESEIQYTAEGFEQLATPFVNEPILHPVLWSDATYHTDADRRTDLVMAAIDPTESAHLVSAGTLQIQADGRATIASDGLFRYYPLTEVQASVTVRDASATMSGWAGVNDHEIGRVDLSALAARALDKCQRSANPVAVEPQRYTAILEPQATADFFSPVIRQAMARVPSEMGRGPFAGEDGNSKIGLRVLDPRLTVRSDPMDPDGGFVPYEQRSGDPFQQVDWFTEGVLKALSYERDYALGELGLALPLLNPHSYRIMGGTTSIDDMIKSTTRGLLITRFHNVQTVDADSMLCTGFTRDGLWLIEHGIVTKAVKNMRFTDSPLFALNNLENMGPSVRVFAPNRAIFAPAVKVRDFNLTALADAV